MTDWLPLFAEESEEAARLYESLRPGIPADMEPYVRDWLRGALTHKTLGPKGRPVVNHSLAQAIELTLQIRGVANLPTGIRTFENCDVRHAESALWKAAGEKSAHLSLVDMALASSVTLLADPMATGLESVLAMGKSEYQVGMRGEKVRLTKRVPDGVLFVAAEVVGRSGRAGRHLADAWGYCYGLESNSNSAYKSAVLAVETLACALVEPNNGDATLGTTIAQMRRDTDWRMPFLREDQHFASPEVLRGMMRTLWRGDYARHANRVWPQDVSQSEAKGALSLAFALVDMLASNGVSRRPAHEVVREPED